MKFVKRNDSFSSSSALFLFGCMFKCEQLIEWEHIEMFIYYQRADHHCICLLYCNPWIISNDFLPQFWNDFLYLSPIAMPLVSCAVCRVQSFFLFSIVFLLAIAERLITLLLFFALNGTKLIKINELMNKNYSLFFSVAETIFFLLFHAQCTRIDKIVYQVWF